LQARNSPSRPISSILVVGTLRDDTQIIIIAQIDIGIGFAGFHVGVFDVQILIHGHHADFLGGSGAQPKPQEMQVTGSSLPRS
jgi:type 1 glutamine amidotransferase